MPLKVACTGCGVTLTTPDSSAGKRAKCPKCGGVIQIPETQQEEIFDAESSLFDSHGEQKMTADAAIDERVPCRACGEMIMRNAIKCRFCGEILDKSLKGMLNTSGNINDPAWLKVRSGLSTIYNCIGILVAVAILMGIAAAMMDAGARGEEPGALLFVFGLGGLVIMCAGIGMLVGLVRCTNVPAESGAHGFAIGAVLGVVGNILLSLAGGASQSDALSGIGSLMSMIGWILFILFLKRSATYLGDHDLASSAGKFLLLGVVMFVIVFALGVLSAVGGPALVIIMAICAIVGGLIGFIWYIRLIRGLVLTIDNGLDPKRSPAVWE